MRYLILFSFATDTNLCSSVCTYTLKQVMTQINAVDIKSSQEVKRKRKSFMADMNKKEEQSYEDQNNDT